MISYKFSDFEFVCFFANKTFLLDECLKIPVPTLLKARHVIRETLFIYRHGFGFKKKKCPWVLNYGKKWVGIMWIVVD
jgi:hypothetical protein